MNKLKKFACLLLSFTMMFSLTAQASAYSNCENNFDTAHERLEMESIFPNIDQIEETEEGTLYYISEPEGTVLKTVDNDVTTLKVEEGGTDSIIEIDKDNNVYLNGEQVVVTYEDLNSENENTIAPKINTRYTESDSGDPTLYTSLGRTEKVANIIFDAAIGSLTSTAVLGVIGFLVPGICYTTSVALALITADAALNITELSCVIRHYYKENAPGGWYAGSFSEKIETTWYSQLNFEGDFFTTSHYRYGYFI